MSSDIRSQAGYDFQKVDVCIVVLSLLHITDQGIISKALTARDCSLFTAARFGKRSNFGKPHHHTPKFLCGWSNAASKRGIGRDKMGRFLDNSGDINFDAELTRQGRQRLAREQEKGSERKYDLQDEED